jgi:hypothetical protein
MRYRLRQILDLLGSLLLLLVLLAFLLLLLPSAHSAEELSPAMLPEQIRARLQETVFATFMVKGVQLYECRVVRADPAAYGWAFIATEAALFDAAGNRIAEHYAGPSWHAEDGSRMTGQLRAEIDPPRRGAVVWQLFRVIPGGRPGLFSRASSLQQVNTAGGVMPPIVCHHGNAGAIARVPYTADHYLLREQ